MTDPYDSLEEVQRIKADLWSRDPDAELAEASVATRLVAHGDSWFDYPPGLDVLDNLRREYDYKIYKVAEAGHTIENLAYGTEIRRDFSRRPPQLLETLRAIERHRPRVVLLSAGGNDLAGAALEAFLNHKDSGLPILREDYTQFVFFDVFRRAYQYIAQNVWAIDPDIHVVTHGYGEAVPDGRAVLNVPGGYRFVGPWLRPALARKNVTDRDEAASIVRRLIGTFNEMLQSLDEADDRFHYLDLRPHIGREHWVNELHLSNRAYRRVAGIFHQRILELV